MIPAHPLQWPVSRDRTKAPGAATYSTILTTAYDYVLKQLTLLGAKKIVISSNAVLKKDGKPSAKQPKIADSGVAVWFQWSGSQTIWYSISCDIYNSIADNLRAIGLSVIDIRNITRRLNTPLIRMFMATPPQDQSQQQKPPPRQEPPPPRQEYKREAPQFWRSVLSVSLTAGWPETKRAYYQLAKIRHPDTGGSAAQFQELSRAYSEAKKYFGVS
ncbi:J domain-containing protein [Spirosoma sp.]|uniref:J domain-containing protein n=1 Tax=Spirosoma sp. TaxID=1899569 RepID=UPI003B3B6881